MAETDLQDLATAGFASTSRPAVAVGDGVAVFGSVSQGDAAMAIWRRAMPRALADWADGRPPHLAVGDEHQRAFRLGGDGHLPLDAPAEARGRYDQDGQPSSVHNGDVVPPPRRPDKGKMPPRRAARRTGQLAPGESPGRPPACGGRRSADAAPGARRGRRAGGR